MAKEVNISEKVQGATEVVFSFDTTGSMASCIANVRDHIEKTCEELFQNIPKLRIGLISHGDYCDGANAINVLPLTDDRAKIYDFIRNTPNTGGGDAPECYELALHRARNMGWSDGEGKMLVLIGDDEPHTADYPGNTDHLDWKKEIASLKESGVNVFPLQCLFNERRGTANKFWEQVAEIGGTEIMKLDDFADTAETFKAAAYATAGGSAFKDYEDRLAVACADSGEVLKHGLCANNVKLRTYANRSKTE